MGLDTSHGCFSGAYSTFNRYRDYMAKLVGINTDEMEGLGGDKQWPSDIEEPLCIMINHSDCDGDIPKDDILPLLKRLKELLPLITDEYWKSITEQWINGLTLAHDSGEKVEFH